MYDKLGELMVVKSIKLGQYKGLHIPADALKIDRQLIINKMKEMMIEKASSSGLNSSMAESVIVLDDEAAAAMQIDGVDNLLGFEEHIRKSMFRDHVINNVMRHVLDNVSIEYDQKEVEQELDCMMSSIEEQAVNEGFTLAFYCDYNNIKNEDELRENCRNEIYTSYLEIHALEAIAQKEGIIADDVEFNLLKDSYMTSHESSSSIDEDALRRSLVIKSTVNWLVLNNTIDKL